MFTLRAKELDPLIDEGHSDFEHLYERLGEDRFIAFVHHGEKRGRVRLGYYRDEVDHKTRAMLDAILVDEAQHEAYTAGQPWNPVWWEARRTWLRAGNLIATAVFVVLMRLLYLIAFPIALVIKWQRS